MNRTLKFVLTSSIVAATAVAGLNYAQQPSGSTGGTGTNAGSTTLTWILSYGRPATLNEVATNPSVVVSGHRKDVSGLAQRRRGHAYAAILWHDSVR